MAIPTNIKTLLSGEVVEWARIMTREEAKSVIGSIRAEAADLPEMTLDEINAEIKAARVERKVGR